MKKRLVAPLLCCSMLLLCSCSLLSDFRSMLRDIRYINSGIQPGYNHDGTINYEFDESVKDTIEDQFAKIEEMLQDNNLSRSTAFVLIYGQLLSNIYYVSDHANLAYLELSKDTSNEANNLKSKELSFLANDYHARLVRLYEPIYYSAYSEEFYSQWEEEEIQKALKMGKMYSEKYVELKNKGDEYVRNYEALDQTSDSFLADSASYYYDIVQNNLNIAKEMGEQSYAEYAYDMVYGRDYTPEDARYFHQHVKEYVVPLGKSTLQDLQGYKNLNSVLSATQKLIDTSVTFDEMEKILTPYYKTLGNNYSKAFENFNQHYFSVNNKNSLKGAYTFYLNYYRQPVCFFGSGSQALMTYIHEQGHYSAFYSSGGSIDSVDLCEVQSQSNEWLYLSYISSDYSEKDHLYLAKNFLLNDILTVTMSACCDAFEQYVYAHPELKAGDYDRVFAEQAEELGAYDFLKSAMSYPPENYWHYAIVANSLYYLSYAVSLIPTLEIYVTAEEQGFEQAVRLYKTLSDVETGETFLEVLEKAGLSSPFDEQVFRRIQNYFK